ncbi:hypothetical protein FSP39_019151 [Pinctada imbricata]|uniref:AAA domain-containing protein n=1 Tax=Pinctada imbricata TaxID=66713 RepID=A0AA88YNX4_PINIB|nr:hypothetical protein FSP39_019151 [Pinctada imbricata]
MLRLVAFENLINFKDRQCLEFKEGVNFLVGANSTGKSSILELIRRCHSVNLSSSVTNLLDDSKTGYVISRYEGLSDVFGKKDTVKTDRAILCYLQDRDASLISIYKCICFESNASGELHIAASLYERNDDSPEKMIRRFSLQNINDDSIGNFIDVYFPKEKDSNQTEQNERNHEKQDEGDFGIGSLFEHGTQENKRIELDFLTKIKEVLEQSGRIDENETSEILLEKLQSSFAHVFPVRSIGPLQWINGNNVREIDASKNYKNVHKRAEILWDLLPPEEPQRELLPRNWLLWITSLWSILSNLVTRNSSLEYENVDENEHSLFKRVTYPLEYVFVKDAKKEQIKAFYKNDPGSSQRQFQMVKTPEGIIEAKQATLILSHKKFKTICYEDIDRGMHTQMIENMNTFLLKSMKGKTVILLPTIHHLLTAGL